METTATIFASTLTVWVAIVGIMLWIGWTPKACRSNAIFSRVAATNPDKDLSTPEQDIVTAGNLPDLVGIKYVHYHI